MRREEDNINDLLDDTHLEEKKIDPDEYQIPTKAKSIIIAKRRADASSSEQAMDLGGKYSLGNVMESSLGNPQDANRALLGDSKIKDGVEMDSQLRGHGDFQRFNLSNEMELAATSSRILAGFSKPLWLTPK